MAEKRKNCSDEEVTIVDLEPAEHPHLLITLQMRTSQFLLSHKKIVIRLLLLLILFVIIIILLDLSPSRVLWLSKISGVPLDAVTLRIQGRVLYAQRKIDGTPLWHATLDSVPAEPPQIADNTVYALSENNILYAFNALHGTLLWHYHIGDFTTFRPIAVNHILYAASPSGVIKALQINNGHSLWETSLPGKVTNNLLLKNNTLYICINGNIIYALRATDGSLLWKYASPSMITSSLIAMDGTVYYSIRNNTIIALNGQDGTLSWQRQIDSIVSGTSRTNFIFGFNNIVLYISSNINTEYGDIHLIAVRPSNGLPLWQKRINTFSIVSSVFSEQDVYILTSDGTLLAYKSNSGELLWLAHLGNAYTLSLAMQQEYIYIYAVDGACNVLNATNGKFLLHYRTNFRVSSPTIIGIRVYVMIPGSQIRQIQYYSGIVAFNAETGEILWCYLTFTPLSEPTFANNSIYADDIQGAIYAFNANSGALIWKR